MIDKKYVGLIGRLIASIIFLGVVIAMFINPEKVLKSSAYLFFFFIIYGIANLFHALSAIETHTKGK